MPDDYFESIPCGDYKFSDHATPDLQQLVVNLVVLLDTLNKKNKK
jgi:hypothetical protein